MIQVAMPWMQLGFVGLLEVEEVLLLWDRVFGKRRVIIFVPCSSNTNEIGFMDVSILSVMAAAIFLYRTVPLLQVTIIRSDALTANYAMHLCV